MHRVSRTVDSLAVVSTMRRGSQATALLLIAIAGGLAVADDIELAVPLDGGPFVADLVGIEKDRTIRLRDGVEVRRLAYDEFVSWGALRDVENGPVIVLSDGSLLRIDPGFRLGRDTLDWNSELWKATKVPRKLVRGVLLQTPWARKQRDESLQRIAEFDETQDQVILDNGDVIRGTITVAGDEIRVESGDQVASVKRHLASSMSLRRSVSSRSRTEAAAWLVGLRDGSALWTDNLIVGDETGYVDLAAGLRLKPAESAVLTDKICLLRAMNDRVVYLSDVQPLGYRHIPMLDLEWPYREDQSVLGGRLRCTGRIFTKGLGLHSTSRIAYRLTESFRRFDAEVCIDDRSEKRGSVVCRVYADDGSGWQLVHETPVVRGGDRIHRLSVELNRVLRFSLIVDRADQGDEWDHVNWLNARLIKSD